MHQHLMRMQPNMAAYYPSNLTTDHIQQYLDENKSLILKIVESQSSGKLSESAENQARLQRNLMYLAAIADSQPPPPTLNSQQYAGGGNLQQQQQQQQMAAQSLVAVRSSMYGAQPYPSLQQHGGMSSGGNSGLMLQGGAGSSGGGGFPDFIRGDGARGLGGGRGGGESLYFKSNEDGN